VLVAQSRVQAKIHTLTEVAVGAALGIAVTALLFRIWYAEPRATLPSAALRRPGLRGGLRASRASGRRRGRRPLGPRPTASTSNASYPANCAPSGGARGAGRRRRRELRAWPWPPPRRRCLPLRTLPAGAGGWRPGGSWRSAAAPRHAPRARSPRRFPGRRGRGDDDDFRSGFVAVGRPTSASPPRERLVGLVASCPITRRRHAGALAAW
jgi:hypothetical protein